MFFFYLWDFIIAATILTSAVRRHSTLVLHLVLRFLHMLTLISHTNRMQCKIRNAKCTGKARGKTDAKRAEPICIHLLMLCFTLQASVAMGWMFLLTGSTSESLSFWPTWRVNVGGTGIRIGVVLSYPFPQKLYVYFAHCFLHKSLFSYLW